MTSSNKKRPYQNGDF